MSDTPMTDAAAQTCMNTTSEWHGEWVPLEVARQLEHKLASVTKGSLELEDERDELDRELQHADRRENSLMRELNEATAENTRLRAALASSKDPCVYCQLPKDEMAKCRSGFPGCARADDLMGCPELGASLEADRLESELANARLDAARYKYLRALNKCEFALLIDDCLYQDLNFDTEVDRRRNQT